MKDKHPEPCEHFDVSANAPKESAPCHCAPACDWYARDVTLTDTLNDPQAPCKRRHIVADSRTVDMFDDDHLMKEGA